MVMLDLSGRPDQIPIETVVASIRPATSEAARTAGWPTAR
jgi:hypothetical protein